MNKSAGRPEGSNTYDQAIGLKICELIAEGLTLNKISKIDGFPPRSTIRGWIDSVKEFSAMYACARAHQLEYWADQIIDISDDGSNDTYIDDKGNRRTDHDVVHRSKLRTDNRKWLLSKLRTEEYGDSLQSLANKDPEPTKYILKRGADRKSKLDKKEDVSSVKTG